MACQNNCFCLGVGCECCHPSLCCCNVSATCRCRKLKSKAPPSIFENSLLNNAKTSKQIKKKKPISKARKSNDSSDITPEIGHIRNLPDANLYDDNPRPSDLTHSRQSQTIDPNNPDAYGNQDNYIRTSRVASSSLPHEQQSKFNQKSLLVQKTGSRATLESSLVNLDVSRRLADYSKPAIPTFEQQPDSFANPRSLTNSQFSKKSIGSAKLPSIASYKSPTSRSISQNPSGKSNLSMDTYNTQVSDNKVIIAQNMTSENQQNNPRNTELQESETRPSSRYNLNCAQRKLNSKTNSTLQNQLKNNGDSTKMNSSYLRNLPTLPNGEPFIFVEPLGRIVLAQSDETSLQNVYKIIRIEPTLGTFSPGDGEMSNNVNDENNKTDNELNQNDSIPECDCSPCPNLELVEAEDPEDAELDKCDSEDTDDIEDVNLNSQKGTTNLKMNYVRNSTETMDDPNRRCTCCSCPVGRQKEQVPKQCNCSCCCANDNANSDKNNNDRSNNDNGQMVPKKRDPQDSPQQSQDSGRRNKLNGSQEPENNCTCSNCKYRKEVKDAYPQICTNEQCAVRLSANKQQKKSTQTRDSGNQSDRQNYVISDNLDDDLNDEQKICKNADCTCSCCSKSITVRKAILLLSTQQQKYPKGGFNITNHTNNPNFDCISVVNDCLSCCNQEPNCSMRPHCTEYICR